MTDRIYIVYDERAHSGNTDDAIVVLATHDLDEARKRAGKANGVVYSYQEVDGTLCDEQIVAPL